MRQRRETTFPTVIRTAAVAEIWAQILPRVPAIIASFQECQSNHCVRTGIASVLDYARSEPAPLQVIPRPLPRNIILPGRPKLLIAPIFHDLFRFPVFPWTFGRVPWIPGVQTLKMGERWGKMGKKWAKDGIKFRRQP